MRFVIEGGAVLTAEQAQRVLVLKQELERKARLAEIAADADAVRSECESLYDFTRRFWHVLEPTRPFVGGWAIRAMCEHLEAVTRGEIRNLLITVPPGMMKSLLVAVFWPAWEWGPKGLGSMRFLTSSYSETNVHRDNQKMRRLITSPEFRTLWPDIVLAPDQNAKGKFENTLTGGREGRPFGSLTGGRGDRLLIDDPHSVTTAESDVQRAETVKIFREAVTDRLNDLQRSAIVIIMQRLHEADVAGTILSLGLPYCHLNLPMEFEPDRRCVTSIGFEDPRTAAGELLFPERFPRAEVEGLKLSKGSYAYAGQYQQRPAPRDGGMFKRSWFPFVPALPASCTQFTRAWDLGATEGGGDATASVLMTKDDAGFFYIASATQDRLSSAGVQTLIKNTASQDPRGTRIKLPQDPGQAGKDQAQTLVRMLAGYSAKAEPVTGSKETRAKPAEAQAEAGNIKILRTGDPARDAWIEPLLSELSVFPNGNHDDMVDAFADAFADLTLGPGTFRVKTLQI